VYRSATSLAPVGRDGETLMGHPGGTRVSSMQQRSWTPTSGSSPAAMETEIAARRHRLTTGLRRMIDCVHFCQGV